MNPTPPTPPPVGGTAAVAAAATAAPRLSGEIAGLIEAFAERSVTLGEVVTVLHGRAYTMLLILLALPFCTPIPLPGVSTPFGFAIALIGFRLSLRQAPWLPERILAIQLPPRFFTVLLGAARRLICLLEIFLRPRLRYLLDLKVLHHAYGAVVCIAGLLLLLPLPIPFSNLLPALTVVLLGCAMLEHDGYFVVAALACFAVTLAFFALIFWSGAEFVDWLQD